MRQRAKFTPFTPKRARGERIVPVDPTKGFHGGLPPEDLPPGYSPELQNFILTSSGGYIRPRSGLSQYGTYDFNGAVLGAKEIFDVEGNSCGFAPSSRSFSFLHPGNQAWSDLSYTPNSNITHMRGNVSGTSSDYFRTASIYDINTEQVLAVTSNNTDSFKAFQVDVSAGTFSDFTHPDSISSTVASADIVSVNDRLVFFNTLDATGGRFPTRVMWSARGNPRSFLINDGAGFEDIMDMRGAGQAAVRFRDFILLFTQYEIWRGTPTYDAYAFRFDRIVDNIGCPYPKTIVATPQGVIFLGSDRELYMTDGARLAPIGPVEGQGHSRVQGKIRDEATNLDRAWALYDSQEHSYELFYTGAGSPDGYPNRAIVYQIEEAAFWPFDYNLGISSGMDLTDPATLITWEDLNDAWDSYGAQWDDYSTSQKERRVNVFTSNGSTLRVFSTQTDDDGLVIDARWRSGGFKNGMRQVHLAEIWIDHEEKNSPSTLSLYVGSARDDTDRAVVKEVSLPLDSQPVFIPTWKTDRAPDFEIRIADGSTPKIDAFQVTLRDASKF